MLCLSSGIDEIVHFTHIEWVLSVVRIVIGGAKTSRFSVDIRDGSIKEFFDPVSIRNLVYVFVIEPYKWFKFSLLRIRFDWGIIWIFFVGYVTQINKTLLLANILYLAVKSVLLIKWAIIIFWVSFMLIIILGFVKIVIFIAMARYVKS